VSRYKLNPIIIAPPNKGFLIQTPTGKTLFDTCPRGIVKELNRLNDRITQLETENDALRADLLLWRDTTDAMCSKAGIGFTTEVKP
jgi:hypothetical protein